MRRREKLFLSKAKTLRSRLFRTARPLISGSKGLTGNSHPGLLTEDEKAEENGHAARLLLLLGLLPCLHWKDGLGRCREHQLRGDPQGSVKGEVDALMGCVGKPIGNIQVAVA